MQEFDHDRDPVTLPVSDPTVIAEPDRFVTEEPVQPPRRGRAVLDVLWTALAVPAISWLMFLVASVVMMVVAYAAVHGHIDRRVMTDPDAMRTVSQSRVGLPLMVVTPQLALVAAAAFFAAFSSQGFRKRLSLVRGHWPLWAWGAAAVTTPLIGWISSIAVGSLMEESDNLKMMSDIFRDHGQSGFLIPLALMIGATPALCEELLFRGFVQTRLNLRLGAFWGILISSALFAVFHMDWVHIIAVFPLGLYLGTICWRSGSLFPAMLAHFINNAISVFAVVWGPEQPDQAPSLEMGLFLLVVLCTGFVGAVATAIAFWSLPGPSLDPLPELHGGQESQGGPELQGSPEPQGSPGEPAATASPEAPPGWQSV